MIRYCSALLLPNYREESFCSNLFFLDCSFLDSYFHGFSEEPVNPQESIREKTHLVTIHLQE